MQELLKNARLGWLNYTGNGKIAVLLLAVLLFIWLSGSWKKQKALFLYTTVLTVCCIVPATAAILMTYQTRFYDYEWIWSLVPVTVMIAYGITEFAAYTGDLAQKEYAGRTRQRGLFLSGTGALAIVILLLCGGLGSNTWKVQPEAEVPIWADRAECESVLSVLTKQEPEACLLAPQSIMEYAMSFDRSIPEHTIHGQILRLPYGRNMWDKHLNAYSYDVYDKETEQLYQWMCGVERTGELDVTVKDGKGELFLSGKACLEIADNKGVNSLVLPENISEEALRAAEELWGSNAFKTGRFYLLVK